jgi:hypothetical protein
MAWRDPQHTVTAEVLRYLLFSYLSAVNVKAYRAFATLLDTAMRKVDCTDLIKQPPLHSRASIVWPGA